MAGVHCYSAFRLHSEHAQGRGVSSYPMLSQELRAVASRMGNDNVSGRRSLARAAVAQ